MVFKNVIGLDTEPTPSCGHPSGGGDEIQRVMESRTDSILYGLCLIRWRKSAETKNVIAQWVIKDLIIVIFALLLYFALVYDMRRSGIDNDFIGIAKTMITLIMNNDRLSDSSISHSNTSWRDSYFCHKSQSIQHTWVTKNYLSWVLSLS